MSKFWKKIVSLICMMLCITIFATHTLWSATYQDRDAAHEVIILFDLSSSAQWHESGLLSADVLWQLMDGLPLEWNVGLITFDSNIVNSIPPRADTRASIHAVLSDPSYEHTYRIPAFFSDLALSHTIMLLANNEMAVLEPDTAHLANIALEELILGGLFVHSLNLSDEYAQAEENYIDTRDLVVPGFPFAPDLLLGQDASQEFSVYLSGEPDDSQRVLIVSENAVEYVFVSYNGHIREAHLGRRLGIVEVLSATDAPVRVDFSAVGQTSVNVASMQESDAINVSGDNQLMRFWLSGAMEESLFLSSFFDGALVPLFVDGVAPGLGLVAANVDIVEPLPQVPTVPAVPSPVVIAIDLQTPPETATDDLDNDEDDEYYQDTNQEDDPATADVTPPTAEDTYTPDEPTYYDEYETPSGFNSTFIIWGVIIILLILFLLFAKRRKQDKAAPARGSARVAKKERAKKTREQKPLSKEADAKPKEAIPVPIPVAVQEPPNPEELLEFAKKFDIYLNQTDTKPAAFALFKMGRAKETSLQKILRKCSNIRIEGDLTSTAAIRFSVDSQGALKAVNDSHFKVCVKDSQLQTNESRTLLQGDNVHIFFEGERELVLSPRFLYQMSK